MKALWNNVEDEYIIQKSKFITLLCHIKSTDEVNTILKKIRDEYKGATHYCYAYIVNQVKRFSDDGEPGGTAGMPILHVLEENNCNHILAIVIRYFGGIKLGAGGLVRAYSNSVIEALKKASLRDEIIGNEIEIILPYDNVKKVDYILDDIEIKEKIFDDKVKYILLISDIETNIYLEKLKPLCLSINILYKDILI